MRRYNPFVAALLLVGMAAILCAQSIPATQDSALPDKVLRLNAGDVIQIHAVEEAEMSDKPIRIGVDGYVSLPTVGRIKAADRTTDEVQQEIVQKLKRLIVNPDVTVTTMETHSHPVSVVGAVKTPGVFELTGRKTLLEVLSLSGGPREDAGYIARITRQKEFGPIPLPNTKVDESGQFSVAEVNLQQIMDAHDPTGNIVMMPNDVVSVPKANMVYVIGDVLRAGGIALGGQKSVTVLQALSIASGLGKTAKAKHAKILRITPGSMTRTEVAVNLKTIMAGKTSDIAMQPEDILFVPTSLKKDVGLRTLEALGGGPMTALIYRIP